MEWAAKVMLTREKQGLVVQGELLDKFACYFTISLETLIQYIKLI